MAREALEVARRDAADLILLDVTMPRMDGLEACRRLRSDPSVGFVPIILVTAHAQLEGRRRRPGSGNR